MKIENKELVRSLSALLRQVFKAETGGVSPDSPWPLVQTTLHPRVPAFLEHSSTAASSTPTFGRLSRWVIGMEWHWKNAL